MTISQPSFHVKQDPASQRLQCGEQRCRTSGTTPPLALALQSDGSVRAPHAYRVAVADGAPPLGSSTAWEKAGAIDLALEQGVTYLEWILVLPRIA
jgi:hypothetical protein